MPQTVTEWLAALRLDKYAERFIEQDVGRDVLPDLTEEHLKELGLTIGERVRLIRALRAEQRPAAVPLDTPDAALPGAGNPPSGEAERRQLTVMFCDLVGSTALSTRLDPEDLRDLLLAYHDTCAAVIARFNGYIAKYMGDGVLVYFGYPQAHENDARRAAAAGLEVIEAVAALDRDAGAAQGVELAVRIGIATGLVVVGDIIGDGASEEANVVGETPNIAARLQAIAGENEVLISPLTHSLIDDAFACADLGKHGLKGLAEPLRAWRVVAELTGEVVGEIREKTGQPPLVGRREELGLLLRSWDASKLGRGQAVLIQGEGGIGKSRLVHALREQVAGDDYLWTAVRCSPYHANSMLYPVIEHLKRAFGWQLDDTPQRKLVKLEAVLATQSQPLAEVVPLYAYLMSLPLPDGRYPPPVNDPRQLREQTLDALLAWLLEEAERRPVLQLWDDLHWADPTTLELVGLYIDQSPTVAIMNVLTYRPDFRPPWSPRSHLTPITLNRLERAEVEAIIHHQAGGKTVPEEVVAHIADKADGVPLYAEELTRTILDSEYLHEETDRYTLAGPLSELAIPATLQESLMARLDRLPELRELAQFGSVIGREFGYDMLQALVGEDEQTLRGRLDRLVAAELLYQRGRAQRAKYIFKHALIQDAAYGSLLKRNRQHHHRKIAELLEQRFSERIHEHPELVAHHYSEAQEHELAVGYWRQAGEGARRRSANLEAIAYFSQGIAALQKLPGSPERDRAELALLIPLGHANVVAKGHGAEGAEVAYARALEICERMGSAPELAATLFGLWRFYVVAKPLPQTLEIAHRLSKLAEARDEETLRVMAHYALGYTHLCLGAPETAKGHLEEGLRSYHPTQRDAEIYRAAQDPGVACHAYLGMVEWLLGHPLVARQHHAESVRLAEQIGDAFSLAYALCFTGAILAEISGEAGGSDLERGLEIAGDGGFSLWIAFAEVQQANAAYREVASARACADLRDKVQAVSRLGVHVNTPYFMTLLARACRDGGRSEEGREVLQQALESAEERDERWWEAEIRRLEGELILTGRDADTEAAEASFRKAREIAALQGARFLELRAVSSLALLWHSLGERGRAVGALHDCIAGFDAAERCADLDSARAQLTAWRQAG